MPDGKAQVGYELINRRAYRPLLVIVDPLEQMGLTGWHSRWHCDPESRQRFPQPTWWPNEARGHRRLGHMSHDLRQFIVRRLPARFDELDDECVYIHRGHYSIGRWMCQQEVTLPRGWGAPLRQPGGDAATISSETLLCACGPQGEEVPGRLGDVRHERVAVTELHPVRLINGDAEDIGASRPPDDARVALVFVGEAMLVS